MSDVCEAELKIMKLILFFFKQKTAYEIGL